MRFVESVLKIRKLSGNSGGLGNSEVLQFLLDFSARNLNFTPWKKQPTRTNRKRHTQASHHIDIRPCQPFVARDGVSAHFDSPTWDSADKSSGRGHSRAQYRRCSTVQLSNNSVLARIQTPISLHYRRKTYRRGICSPMSQTKCCRVAMFGEERGFKCATVQSALFEG